MIHIKRLLTEIEAVSKINGRVKKFGFEIDFKDGLNIITGNNTSGKSTIISCIYYCLGLEQLMGGKNEIVLDNSLRREFRIKEETFHVNYSAAKIIISNSNGVIASLKRKITSFSSENESQKIYIDSNNNNFIKFIHSKGDTLRENGFFNWLEDFIGIELPTVTTFDAKESKLYFQNIFSGVFIEQKKGWSDYFSTSPTFSIKNVNQKIFGFLLGLNSLDNDFEVDKIKADIKDLKTQWDIDCERFKGKLEKYDVVIKGLPTNKIITKSELQDVIQIFFLDESGQQITKDKYIANIKQSLRENEEIVNNTVENNLSLKNVSRERIIDEINKVKKSLEEVQADQIEEKDKVSLFELKIKALNLNIQNLQDLKKVKNEGQFLAENIDFCPLCHERIQGNNIDVKNNIDDNTIDQSIDYLKSQLSLYKSYLKTSSEVSEKFKSYIEYYRRLLIEKQFKLQIANEEITKDVRIPSKQVLVDTVLKEQKLINVKFVDELVETFINDVSHYFTEYLALQNQLKTIQQGEDKDCKKLSKFERVFKDLLKKFGYTSQNINLITIENSEPQRLLPAINIEGQKESLRTTSSASDFVRALWAFYIALMQEGKNHPKILIFDEPGQHAMMLNSLQSLAEECAKLKTSQVILAMSKDKPGQEHINLSDILINIDKDAVNIYSINENGKCIHEIPEEKHLEHE